MRLLLAELGVQATQVRPSARQVWGVAKYEATEIRPGTSSGRRLDVSVYGRDAADAGLLTKAGRFLLYRDSGPSLTITRLQQVEREGFVTLRAAQVGASVPELAGAGTAGPSEDALVVTRLPAGRRLAEASAADISDATVDDIYRQLLTLRAARIAHGAISGDTLLVDPARQTAVIADFRNATATASPVQLDRDVAGVIAATAVTLGPDRRGAAPPGAWSPACSRPPSATCRRPPSTRPSAAACAGGPGYSKRPGSTPPRRRPSTCLTWWSRAG